MWWNVEWQDTELRLQQAIDEREEILRRYAKAVQPLPEFEQPNDQFVSYQASLMPEGYWEAMPEPPDYQLEVMRRFQTLIQRRCAPHIDFIFAGLFIPPRNFGGFLMFAFLDEIGLADPEEGRSGMLLFEPTRYPLVRMMVSPDRAIGEAQQWKSLGKLPYNPPVESDENGRMAAIRYELSRVDLNETTPLQALSILARLKSLLE